MTISIKAKSLLQNLVGQCYSIKHLQCQFYECNSLFFLLWAGRSAPHALCFMIMSYSASCLIGFLCQIRQQMQLSVIEERIWFLTTYTLVQYTMQIMISLNCLEHTLCFPSVLENRWLFFCFYNSSLHPYFTDFLTSLGVVLGTGLGIIDPKRPCWLAAGMQMSVQMHRFVCRMPKNA